MQPQQIQVQAIQSGIQTYELSGGLSCMIPTAPPTQSAQVMFPHQSLPWLLLLEACLDLIKKRLLTNTLPKLYLKHLYIHKWKKLITYDVYQIYQAFFFWEFLPMNEKDPSDEAGYSASDHDICGCPRSQWHLSVESVQCWGLYSQGVSPKIAKAF